MIRVLSIALLGFIFLSGCSSQVDTITPAQASAKKEPMYVDENTLTLFAMDAQNQHKYGEAVGYYDLLYKNTKDPIYQDQAIDALASGAYYNDIISRLKSRREAGEKLSSKNRRYFVLALLAKKLYAEAEVEAKTLLKEDPSEENYLLIAQVYRVQEDYVKTLSTLDEAYKLNYSERILDLYALIVYTKMNEPYQAIAKIEEHNENFGYSLPLSKRLVTFYRDQHDVAGLLKTYPHLYALEPTKENADVLIQLYWNASKLPELMQFLERTHTNDELLLKLYSSDKQYKKAIALAEKLYDKTGDIDFLGQKAIFMYEASSNKNDKALLDSVIGDLTQVVAVKKEGYYLNYLGYCMIEHDRNVSKGIAYVKEALALEPDSGYFIDSLAWGYYKEDKCAEADVEMQKVVELLGSDDAEVKAHLKAIKSCLQRKNK